MHTCISSHGLKRSWRSCPRRVNAGNKNTPSTHHPRRRNVTTLMVELKNGHTQKSHPPKIGEPQRYSWGTQKKKKNTVDTEKGTECIVRQCKSNGSLFLYFEATRRSEWPCDNTFTHRAVGKVTRPSVRVRTVVVCWLLNVPATWECTSGTDLLRQVFVLPHWDRNCRSNFPSHPVTVYWHRANQSQHWPYNARRLAW